MKRVIVATAIFAIFAIFAVTAGKLYANEWRYSEVRDEMRDTVTYNSTLQSENEKQYSAPYSRGTSLDILLFSNDEKTSNTAAITLSKGQISCQREMDCEVKVRFDDGSVEDLTTKIVGDSYDMLAIFNAPGFVEKLRLSKRVIIEVPVYREGNSQFKFSPSGLKWHGIADGKPYLSEVGGINLKDKMDLNGKTVSKKNNGLICFDDSIELIKGWVIPANLCTYEGNVALISIETKNDKKRLREMVDDVNKSLGVKVNIYNDSASWLDDETLGISSIIISSDDKEGLRLFFTYWPVMSKVPPIK